jgi:lysophospholipase L1-like esterase
VKRILLLGDSFTFGAANHYEDAFPLLLERTLQAAGYHADIVKAGVPAYDTRAEVLFLERLYPDYNPDIVALVFLPNDLFTNYPVDHRPGSDRTPVAVLRGRLDKASSALHVVDLAKRLLISNDFVYSALYLMTPRAEYFRLPLSEHLSRQIEITKALLHRAVTFCAARGVELLVVSIPQQFQVVVQAHRFAFRNIDIELPDRELGAYAKDLGCDWIALLPRLSQQYRTSRTEQYFRIDGHLTQAGNRVVAEELASQFSRLLGAGRPAPYSRQDSGRGHTNLTPHASLGSK